MKRLFILVTLHVAVGLSASAQTPYPTELRTTQSFSNLVLAVKAATEGPDDEAVSLVTQTPRGGEQSYLARLRTGRAVAQIAIQLAENNQYLRGVAFVERTLQVHEDIRSELDADKAALLRALATEAFLFYHVLRDNGRAYAAFNQCRRLDPGNETYQAMVAKLQLSADEGRIFSTATPLLNKAYHRVATAPTLQVSGGGPDGFPVTVDGLVSGTYRVEQSTDLLSWTLFYRASNVSIPLRHVQMTKDVMFFRIVLETDAPPATQA